MESYEELRSRWRGRLEEGTASHNFGPDELAPGKFCVLYSDVGGSGACSSSVELVGGFEGPKGFLSFLRFAEMPRVLDFHTCTYRDIPDVADAYLLSLDEELRNKVDWLLGLIDRALKSLMISTSELSIICDKFNETFDSTNPSVQILAWGSLADVLTSSTLEEPLEEVVNEEVGEDEQPCTQLKALLDASQFDDTDGSHLSLARLFLSAQLSA